MIPDLYFPQDKTEYIPAVLLCLLFCLAAFITVRIFIMISKKEMRTFTRIEEKIMLQSEKKKEGK